ncbi:hypothetical protein IP81_08805 [Novosphingobium sp. AAP83]|uniref:hypothetical protein n=1 Tax=Novosphingobium sp. AAP83 TaxID=1523425 RepID=UPI0006B95108|nr:hypothetical protein [Novosphingobium sp. AAP83]KPF92117.1 hypothetical protein IP81_08805 [Novosphingobium sp. AAP83]
MSGKKLVWTVGRFVSSLPLTPEDQTRINDDYGLPYQGQIISINHGQLFVRDPFTGKSEKLVIGSIQSRDFPRVIRLAIASLGIRNATGFANVSAPDNKALFAVIEAGDQLIALVPYCKVDAKGVPGSECAYVGQPWSH